VGGGGQPVHVQPDLGDDDLCCLRGDAGDLGEPGYRWHDRVTGALADSRAGRTVGVDSLRGRHFGNQLFDPRCERVDLGGQGIDLGQQDRGELAVVVIEPAGQRLDQRCALGLRPANRPALRPRSTSPRPGGPWSPSARLALPRHPRADHPGRLRHINRRHPRHGALVLPLFDLLRLPHHEPPSGPARQGTPAGSPGAQASSEILTGVLMATMHGPSPGPGARLRNEVTSQATTGINGQPCQQFSDAAWRRTSHGGPYVSQPEPVADAG
jgi:hypothetical protein